jgi:hypothetical protein
MRSRRDSVRSGSCLPVTLTRLFSAIVFFRLFVQEHAVFRIFSGEGQPCRHDNVVALVVVVILLQSACFLFCQFSLIRRIVFCFNKGDVHFSYGVKSGESLFELAQVVPGVFCFEGFRHRFYFLYLLCRQASSRSQIMPGRYLLGKCENIYFPSLLIRKEGVFSQIGPKNPITALTFPINFQRIFRKQRSQGC